MRPTQRDRCSEKKTGHGGLVRGTHGVYTREKSKPDVVLDHLSRIIVLEDVAVALQEATVDPTETAGEERRESVSRSSAEPN